eukprot:6528163-Prymnesium_polylepis.1
MLHVVKGTRVELEVDLTSRNLRSRGNLSYRCEREVRKEGGERLEVCSRAHGGEPKASRACVRHDGRVYG